MCPSQVGTWLQFALPGESYNCSHACAQEGGRAKGDTTAGMSQPLGTLAVGSRNTWFTQGHPVWSVSQELLLPLGMRKKRHFVAFNSLHGLSGL